MGYRYQLQNIPSGKILSADCITNISAYLWHYGAVDDAMAAAAYIKFENPSSNGKYQNKKNRYITSCLALINVLQAVMLLAIAQQHRFCLFDLACNLCKSAEFFVR